MKIALLGYGVEGESAYKYYLRTQPGAQFVIYDNAESPKYEVPDGTEFIGSVNDFYNIDADIVIKTPAIPLDKVSSNGYITSVTREFFDKCPASIIGVTGTKGKGTTCTLIAEILKAAGKKTHLVGNIGAPALDELDKIEPDDIVIYELSSFQLWDLNKSPHIAVVLMVEPEHLDVHSSMDEYVAAKSNITEHQNPEDIVVYYDQNDYSRSIANLSKGKKIPYHVEDGNDVVVSGQKIIEKEEIGLLGKHNLENVYGAVNAAWQITQDADAIARAVRNFKGLPHRLEIVATKNDVTFVNDSFSSAPPATVAAMKSFSSPEILIVGGLDRNLIYEDLAHSIASQQNVKKVILIGQTRTKLAAALDQLGWKDYEIDETNDLQSSVQRASKLAVPGNVVLLSPGCPSFDMFKNFTQRGEEFRKLVGEL